jgi:trans-aconitate methyltransferase
MTDHYSPVAEFYELMARQQLDGADALAAALTGIDTNDGPVLDLGAGTGRATEIIATTLPDAQILAVEPAPAMRAVLTSRVIRDDDLRRRVTVVADTAQDVQLPDRLSAAVIFGVAGHLDRTERRQLWPRLSQRLAPGAPIVVELMPLARPQPVASTRIVAETIGEQRYEAWLSGEPAGPDLMRWTSSWRVTRGHTVVRMVDNHSEWFTFSIDDLAAETGLSAKKVAPNLGVLVA